MTRMNKAIEEQVLEYAKAPYRMLIEPDIYEGGFVVSFPDLPGCISCADSMEGAIALGEDAKIEWITAALESGQQIPAPRNLDEYSGQFKLRIPKSLHKKLADHAKLEGISMNQYCLYLLAKNVEG